MKNKSPSFDSKSTITLQDMIDKSINDAVKDYPRDYIGASMIGSDCERALWYDFRWYASPNFPARIRRRFESGDVYEDRVIDYMEATGRFNVQHINPKARNRKKQFALEYGAMGGIFRGHLDGIVTALDANVWSDLGAPHIPQSAPVLLEAKLHASAKYKYEKDDTDYLNPIANKGSGGNIRGNYFEVVSKGVRKAKVTHFAQMQAYMGLSREPDRSGKIHWEKWGLSGPMNHAIYVCVNGDTDQIHHEIIDYSPKWFESITSRAMRIARSTQPPPRIDNNPASWKCRFCSHKPHCQDEETPPNRSCKSCAFSELKLPRDSGYHGDMSIWLCTKHKRMCGDFTPCEAWEKIENKEDMF